MFRLPGSARLAMAGVLAALAALAAAGCAAPRGDGSAIAATAAYVRQPMGKTTVGYLDIRNNGHADRLVSVTTSVGGTVVFRAPARAGVAPIVMRTVPEIPIPANSTTKLIPDSYHLLITGAGPMEGGRDITLRLKFARAGTVTILALVTNPATGGGGYF